jgi:hypothetical protein
MVRPIGTFGSMRKSGSPALSSTCLGKVWFLFFLHCGQIHYDTCGHIMPFVISHPELLSFFLSLETLIRLLLDLVMIFLNDA